MLFPPSILLLLFLLGQPALMWVIYLSVQLASTDTHATRFETALAAAEPLPELQSGSGQVEGLVWYCGALRRVAANPPNQ